MARFTLWHVSDKGLTKVYPETVGQLQNLLEGEEPYFDNKIDALEFAIESISLRLLEVEQKIKDTQK